MASGHSPWWKQKILYRIPGLFKVCPAGNYHWFWDKWCFCCDNCGQHLYSFRLKKFRLLGRWKDNTYDYEDERLEISRATLRGGGSGEE